MSSRAGHAPLPGRPEACLIVGGRGRAVTSGLALTASCLPRGQAPSGPPRSRATPRGSTLPKA
eukprot:4854969-Lingulodinium_polyedra.AAC.1